ncbi:MAG TPA: 2,3-diaminopropionate biosynthesis protein SbnB [Ruminiclostridium sp.]|nr:2,3-diaminopropionate biosynthesis protein SbnB [Ruminiclostridium sp.]
MLYLNESDIESIGMKWEELFCQIEAALECVCKNDFSQPIKPYLRYKNPKNRIIAMPAYVGGNFNVSGIKWIASFPDNVKNHIPRAHSVTVLNNADTGEPLCIVNTARLSIIRTASVTGVMIKHFSQEREMNGVTLGIIGWGPIGQCHFKMCTEAFGEKISQIFLYDKRPIDRESINPVYRDKVHIADSWEKAYEQSDIFITCTVSDAPYIDKKPKAGALLLNVSLRDFKTSVYEYVKSSIIVDDWEEVCREGTDIEMMHIEKGLSKEDTRSMADFILRNGMKSCRSNEPVMFNPMGMAVFDISTGCYYMRKALELGVGTKL